MRPLLDPDRALALVLEAAPGPRPERRPAADALGRILLEPVVAVVAQPPFDKATMDGFAVRCADAGRRVDCLGEVAAGSVPVAQVSPGHVVEIMTGAPCPIGTEAVVQVEETKRENGRVKLPDTIKEHQHIQIEASVCRPGDEVLPSGGVVSSVGLATAVAVGVAEVVVAEAPSMTVITTGSELLAPNSPLGPAQIYDSNGPMLQAMAIRSGVEDVTTIDAEDTRKSLSVAIESADQTEIVVLTGGVSMGRYDLVPQTLIDLGWEQIFHKVRQKPGKPLLVAKKGERLAFGLPGTPLGSHFGFHRYVAAAIRKRLGLRGERPRHSGSLAEALWLKNERTLFRLARAVRDGGGWLILPLEWNGSSDLVGPASANCYVRLEPGEYDLDAGAELMFEFVDGTVEAAFE